jgi:preprotein translocase subunit SecA
MRDVDYIVKDGKVCIIDRNTGRVMEGRRFSGGLHQAVEAKENVEIHQESRVLSSITYQKFFLLYRRLSGMTGTAWSARRELSKTYHLKVRRILPSKPCIRIDRSDRCFDTYTDKLEALADAAEQAWGAKRPVLVGTPNIGVSESVSRLLTQRGIAHVVLSAKQDAGEADIIAKAGLPGSVIVATNMAGRGTDIRLGGGDPKTAELVCKLGGLLVLGAERQRSRRVDDQLIGRAGRQGDPGESIFFVSAQDDLLRLFGDEKAHEITANSLMRAQRRAESLDAGQRKDNLEADGILQEYRKHFVLERDRMLESGNIVPQLSDMSAALTKTLWESYDNPKNQYADFRIAFCQVFGREALPKNTNPPNIASYTAAAENMLWNKEAEAPGVFEKLARAVMLQCIDEAWTIFLEEFEDLKSGYHLMAMGSSDSKHILIKYSAKLLEKANSHITREGLRRIFCCRLERKTER